MSVSRQTNVESKNMTGWKDFFEEQQPFLRTLKGVLILLCFVSWTRPSDSVSEFITDYFSKSNVFYRISLSRESNISTAPSNNCLFSIKLCRKINSMYTNQAKL